LINRFEGFQKDEKRLIGKETVKLAEQRALGVDMSCVEERTDPRGEELTDNELIQLAETKVSTKTKADSSEKLQQ
jgi:hypothetical protein